MLSAMLDRAFRCVSCNADEAFHVVFHRGGQWRLVLEDFATAEAAQARAQAYVRKGVRAKVMTGRDLDLGLPLD